MAPPLPPVLHGPITPASPTVQVTAVLEGARTELLIAGNRIGSTIAPANGTAWVPVDDAPVPGQIVTATQQTADGTSGESPGIQVVATPNPLPAPIFASPLSNAMSTVLLAGLVPGARATISNGGATVGQAFVTQGGQWIDILPGANLAGDTTLTAQQDLDGVVSAVVESLPITRINREAALPAPGIAQPVAACESSLTVTSAVPSADLVVDNEGVTSTWHNVATAYAAWGAPPFQQGKTPARYPRRPGSHSRAPRLQRSSSRDRSMPARDCSRCKVPTAGRKWWRLRPTPVPHWAIHYLSALIRPCSTAPGYPLPMATESWSPNRAVTPTAKPSNL